jgi:hypothetical protein
VHKRVFEAGSRPPLMGFSFMEPIIAFIALVYMN